MVFLPLCLSASLPLCLSASLPLCLSASLPLCLSASLPLGGGVVRGWFGAGVLWGGVVLVWTWGRPGWGEPGR
ncbi:hypothetical protein Acsp05_53230 [Actinokineospora sp. NBRC 105648]|nr:hypothetical protein Acsp05_53230 [Actinokineospora sp. NBRC 105648]